jgi:hypothetical protein
VHQFFVVLHLCQSWHGSYCLTDPIQKSDESWTKIELDYSDSREHSGIAVNSNQRLRIHSCLSPSHQHIQLPPPSSETAHPPDRLTLVTAKPWDSASCKMWLPTNPRPPNTTSLGTDEELASPVSDVDVDDPWVAEASPLEGQGEEHMQLKLPCLFTLVKP